MAEQKFESHRYVCLALVLTIVVLSFTNPVECSSKKSKNFAKKFPFLNNVLIDEDDPCKNVKCTSGQECIIDPETNKGVCVCIRECSENSDYRRRVCSNHNETWQSDCHLLKHRCDCIKENDKDCTEEHKHMHINYYGECKEIETCEKEILEDFPRRMREWLDNIIATIDIKPEFSSNINHQTNKWIDAIIWKFCDQEKKPEERSVSRHELFPLRAPLLSMESCIADFLDNCDSNDDHKITLIEWGECLGATQDEMQNKCINFMGVSSSEIENENQFGD